MTVGALAAPVTPEGYAALLDAVWGDHGARRAADAPTVVSLFAGGGGSSLGYSAAGYLELAAVDWDAHAAATFGLNFPHVAFWRGDVRELDGAELGRIAGVAPGELDVLDGSPPCQGFSTAGKREVGDPRNSLFREFARLLGWLRPRAFVMENVSGLVKGPMRAVFADMMRTLKGSGYRVRCRLMNARWYLVPQDRQRVIFVGVRGDVAAEPSHPGPTSRSLTLREVLPSLRPGWFDDPADLAGMPELGGKYGRVWGMVKPGENASDRFGTGFNNCVKPHPDRPAPTLPAYQGGYGSGTVVHPTLRRALTLSEAKVIGSFPAAYRLAGGTYQQRWARIGNSVPPMLMRAVATHVAGLLGGAARAA